jgi:uncharacterized membrane protein YbhN (UPF0104 family)
MPEALNVQRMRRRVVRLLFFAALVAVPILTVPGLGSIRDRLAHGNPGWLVLAGCFRLASALSHVVLSRAIFAPRMALRASYRIGMSEIAANALAPAGGASGLAIGDWVLHRQGRPWSWLAERTAEFFVFTSAFNVGAVAVLGWLGAGGVLASGVSLLLSLAPAVAATVAIAVALALIPRLAWLEAKQRRRRVHGWRWWLLELGVALGTGARGAVNLFRRRDLAAIAGGAGYLLFDIIMLWATVRVFGGHIGFQPLALAYLVGQLAGEIPIPGGFGAVDGGLIGALVAYGLSSSLAVASSLAYRAIALAVTVVFGGIAAISLMRGIRNQKAQTGIPISEPLGPSTARAKFASPSLTGRTHHALNEPASGPARTQWTHPYDKRPDPRVPDADAMKPESGDVHAPTGATSPSEPHHEGDPRVDRTANPHELMRRERRRAGG